MKWQAFWGPVCALHANFPRGGMCLFSTVIAHCPASKHIFCLVMFTELSILYIVKHSMHPECPFAGSFCCHVLLLFESLSSVSFDLNFLSCSSFCLSSGDQDLSSCFRWTLQHGIGCCSSCICYLQSRKQKTNSGTKDSLIHMKRRGHADLRVAKYWTL